MGWVVLARLQENLPAEPGEPPAYPQCGSVVEHSDPAQGLWRQGTGSGKCNTHLIPPCVWGIAGTRLEACDSPACDDLKRGLECYSPYLVPRMGRRDALGQPTAACWRERRRVVFPWCMVLNSPPLETQRPLFYWCFGYQWLLGQRRNKNKIKQKILRPTLLQGREWCSHHFPMSSLLHFWVACLSASCIGACRPVWQGPERAGHPASDRLMTLPGGRAPTATSWLRGCHRIGSSRFSPVHDVFDRINLLLSCRKLLGKAFDSFAEEAGLRHGSIQDLYLLLLLHVGQTQPEMVLLDHKCGHRMTHTLCGHLHRSKREVHRNTQLV